MKRLIVILSLITISFGLEAKAGLLELRAGVGLNSANPDSFEDEVNQVGGGGLSADEFDNFNADVFFNIPAFPIGVGLRHEWISQDQSSGGNEWEMDATNLSLLVDWRIIDTVFYIGPLVTIGYPTANIDFKNGSSQTSDSLHSGEPSYGLAAEAGFTLGIFLVGAEAGYQSLKLDDFDSSSGDADVDLSGFYGKMMVGLTFL